jgi:F-type H+-transporting ATPase subunit a
MPQGNFILRLIAIGISLAVGVALLIQYKRIKPVDKEDQDYKKIKRKRKIILLFGVLGLWLGCGLIIGIFAAPSEGLNFEIMAPRIDLYGMDISSSVLISWIAMAVLIIAAIIIRVFVIPKFKEKPQGIQNVLEIIVEALSKYTESSVGKLSDNLNAYIFTLGLFLVTCGIVELFGLRPPTADLAMTFSLALCTFALINYYGIKKKGLAGRLKSLAQPTAVILPIRLLTDIAVPISMACRLFGNMLGGMIVIDLLYIALGAFGVGIPAVMGLYFNIFHPLIQAFIFITLSLTFINEAVE